MTEEIAPYGVDAPYPSGPWSGYFTYGGSSRRHGMCLHLAFTGTRLRGDGWDGVGYFVIAGVLDPGCGRCSWTKIYPGSHGVTYEGLRCGRGIGGTWTLPSGGAGLFRIWPGDGNSGEALTLEEAMGLADASAETVARKEKP